MRYDPFREFDRLASSLFDHGTSPRSMPMDAYRRGDEFVVQMDLPGIDPDSIELVVERNVLSVTARRTVDRSDVDELLVSERPQGVYNRQVFLGEGLDTDGLEAVYEAGVLTLRVPIMESARPRRVPVRMAESTPKAIESETTTEPAA